MIAGAGALGAAAAIGMLRSGSSYSYRAKSVFITGGARGLGFLMPELLAGEGARLALVSRNNAELNAAERKLAGTGAEVVNFVCDVRDLLEVKVTVHGCLSVVGSV